MTLVGAHIHVHQNFAWFEATDVVRRLVHTRPLIHGGKPVPVPRSSTRRLTGQPVVTRSVLRTSEPRPLPIRTWRLQPRFPAGFRNQKLRCLHGVKAFRQRAGRQGRRSCDHHGQGAGRRRQCGNGACTEAAERLEREDGGGREAAHAYPDEGCPEEGNAAQEKGTHDAEGPAEGRGVPERVGVGMEIRRVRIKREPRRLLSPESFLARRIVKFKICL